MRGCMAACHHEHIRTVDARNPKPPPGMYKTIKPCKSWDFNYQPQLAAPQKNLSISSVIANFLRGPLVRSHSIFDGYRITTIVELHLWRRFLQRLPYHLTEAPTSRKNEGETPSLKLTASLHLKMDGLEYFLVSFFGFTLFFQVRNLLLVSGRVFVSMLKRLISIDKFQNKWLSPTFQDVLIFQFLPAFRSVPVRRIQLHPLQLHAAGAASRRRPQRQRWCRGTPSAHGGRWGFFGWLRGNFHLFWDGIVSGGIFGRKLVLSMFFLRKLVKHRRNSMIFDLFARKLQSSFFDSQWPNLRVKNPQVLPWYVGPPPNKAGSSCSCTIFQGAKC